MKFVILKIIWDLTCYKSKCSIKKEQISVGERKKMQITRQWRIETVIAFRIPHTRCNVSSAATCGMKTEAAACSTCSRLFMRFQTAKVKHVIVYLC